MDPNKTTGKNKSTNSFGFTVPDGAAEFEVDTIIAGRYRVDEMIGGGGMSTVYRCTDTKHDTVVALKFLSPQYSQEGKWLQRFRQEARAIGKLSHPNIIQIHDYDADPKHPFMVMDLIEGFPIGFLIARDGPMDAKRCLTIMLHVADALEHAHKQGVVHRDLKPTNIMLIEDEYGETAKILDFGIAKINEPENAEIKMTQTGEVFGSPAYMSPEQSRGKGVDERTDQYSFGCVLFECLTACPPFMGDSTVETLMRQINQAPPTLKESSLGKTFDPKIERLVARLLQKEPENRYPSMAAVKEALSEILNPSPVSAADSGEVRNLQWETMRVGVVVGLSVGVFVGLISMYIMWIFKPTSTKDLVVELRNTVAPLSTEQLAKRDAEAHSWGAIKYVRRHATVRQLELNNGAVNDEIMSAISQLVTVDILGLDNCTGLTDKNLSWLARKRALSRLSIQDNPKITDQGVADIIKKDTLVDLRLARCSVGDATAKLIGSSSLRVLDMSDTKITDRGIESLAGSKLYTLILASASNVTTSGFDAIGKMKMLNLLDISSNARVGPCLEKFSRLNLNNLGASNTGIRDSDLVFLKPMNHLAVLILNGTAVTDKGLETIAQLKSLQLLGLKECNGITAAGIARFRTASPECNLEQVDSKAMTLQEIRAAAKEFSEDPDTPTDSHR